MIYPSFCQLRARLALIFSHLNPPLGIYRHPGAVIICMTVSNFCRLFVARGVGWIDQQRSYTRRIGVSGLIQVYTQQ